MDIVGYGIGFDACSQFSLPTGEWGKNVIFNVDNSSSKYKDNRKKDILVLSERPTDGLDNAAITAKAIYSLNIIKSRKQICSSMHYNAANRFFSMIMV